MIGLIATLKVKSGNEQEFEQIMAKLIDTVVANEPGTILYTLSALEEQPLTYKMLELYASAEARKTHGKTSYFREAAAAFMPLLSDTATLEALRIVHPEN